jgi:hypothetical protein
VGAATVVIAHVNLFLFCSPGVLCRRWFPESAVQPVPEAQHLDIILYSREQLLQEYAAMPSKTGGAADPEALLPDVPWGIISIKVRCMWLAAGGDGC